MRSTAFAALFAFLAAGPVAADEPVFAPVARLKVEAEGGFGGEGPAWDPELGVLTSGNGDINRLPRTGKAEVFRRGAGTNGLLFDRRGRLTACDSEQRRMVRIARDGTLTVLTDR